MSEFKDKVEQYKQTIVDAGFTTDDGGITDSPTISSDMTDNTDQGDPLQELHQQDGQEQPKHKKTSRKTVDGLKKRIDQVTFERNVREAQNKELLAKVQEQEQRLAEQRSLLEQNEQYKNAYYENNLQTRQKAIINELKVAKEEGDIEKEISLSQELAKVTADQSTYGLYKSQLQNQPRQNEPINNYDQQAIYPQPTFGNNLDSPDNNYEESNEAYDGWLERNSWADPDSRNFSPRLRQEANQLADEFDEMLRYNGKSEYIGTQAYFESIDNLMSERYAVQGNEPRSRQEYDNEPQPRQSQSYNVAPVSRNGSSMADQYMSRNPNNTRRAMSLSEDEYKIARNLQIKLPNGKYATGDEAVRRYAEAKREQNPHGSQKLVIE
jgi:hypothetical protein